MKGFILKKYLMVTLAMVISLTLVIGSVSTLSAAPPIKTPAATITITAADVLNQTIYYKVEWNNQPRELAPQIYFVEFVNIGFQKLADGDVVTFGGIKTKYSSKVLSIVDAPGPDIYPFASGDVIIGQLWVSAIDGSQVAIASVEFSVLS